MIHRIFLLIVMLIVLPELYSAAIHRRRHRSWPLWRRILRWTPATIMLLWAAWLALQRGFIPRNTTMIHAFLIVLGVVFIPRFLYMLAAFIGRAVKILSHSRHNWGNLIGFFLAIMTSIGAASGFFIGPRQLNVKQQELAVSGLPKAFDGYKIVLFSDAHVGSTDAAFLSKLVSKINDQHADVVAFAGDLQNIEPQELYPYTEILNKITAHDGVYSVLGNHDYSMYQTATDEVIRAANEKEIVSREIQMGWNVLLNDHATISRGGSHIVIAGLENEGKAPMPQRADVKKALKGVDAKAFVIMLEHDPQAWQHTILPQSSAQLTLSGHTHGGQMSLMGLRPTKLTNDSDYGCYEEDGRWLYVTGGCGGLVPFRLGLKPEIVVLTLRCNNDQQP